MLLDQERIYKGKRHMPEPVSSEGLQHYLETLANRLVQENPALKKPPLTVDKLVQDTTDLLRFKEKEYGNKVSMEQLSNPEFINQLVVTMTTMATIGSSKELSNMMETLEKALKEFKKSTSYEKELKNIAKEDMEILDALFDLLEELDQITNLDPSKVSQIKDKMRKKMQKRMSMKAFKKLEALLNMYFLPQNKDSIRDAMKKLMAAIKGNLDKLNKKPGESLEIKQDMYLNLFGVLSSYITGSHPVPMQMYIGNGLGFTDWNPYHGNANIDSVNEINMEFGDSLGIEARTIRNYLRMEDSNMSSFVDLLRSEGLSVARQTAPEAPKPRNAP